MLETAHYIASFTSSIGSIMILLGFVLILLYCFEENVSYQLLW